MIDVTSPGLLDAIIRKLWCMWPIWHSMEILGVSGVLSSRQSPYRALQNASGLCEFADVVQGS